jgi:hypothetical protein
MTLSLAVEVRHLKSIMLRDALSVVAISKYRSLRNLVVPLKAVIVVAGPNRSGK